MQDKIYDHSCTHTAAAHKCVQGNPCTCQRQTYAMCVADLQGEVGALGKKANRCKGGAHIREQLQSACQDAANIVK